MGHSANSWWSGGPEVETEERGNSERGNSSFLSLLPEALQLTQLWPSGWAERPRRLGTVSIRTPEPSPGLPSGPEAVANLPHPSSCDLVSPGCSLWDLVLLSPPAPPTPYEQPGESEGQLGSGHLAPSAMTVGQGLGTWPWGSCQLRSLSS